MASYSCFEALVLAASVHEMPEPRGGAGRTSESKEMAGRQDASPGGQPREETHEGTCAQASDRAPPRGFSMAPEPGGDGCGQKWGAAAAADAVSEGRGRGVGAVVAAVVEGMGAGVLDVVVGQVLVLALRSVRVLNCLAAARGGGGRAGGRGRVRVAMMAALEESVACEDCGERAPECNERERTSESRMPAVKEGAGREDSGVGVSHVAGVCALACVFVCVFA